ncbi:hypothetical protein [Legionella taurinensis]|uniref:Interaptin n=1 Tax=Legionella taurinensis TaxID=70611 RepID=A0A3A5LC72_9GAMM|nr:hypothetical protein [Legionella taurinensis]RJT49211.1 hypothetical protein D6J04_00700 [Legionella taurinensis]RJT67471.1 hypothetical protein D6J03_07660 [Legionella taurinensis]
MAKNQQFAALLNGLNDNPHLANNPGYKAALDAILRTDHTNANALRAALFAHKNVWIAISNGALVDGDFPANDVGNVNFDATDNTAGQRFIDLYQLAAQKRAELALLEANEATLNAIITSNNQQAVRQQFAIAPLDALVGGTAQWHGGFQPNNPNHITDNAADAIKAAAKRTLLIQKIKAAPGTVQTLAQLENLLAARNHDGNFRTAARHLGIADANVRNALTGNLLANGQLEKVALRKAFELRVQHHFTADFNPIANAFNALDQQTATFNPFPQGVFNGVYHNKFNQQDEDANWAKGVLGARYLKEALAVHDDANNLIRIAAAAANPPVGTLQGAITPLFDANGRYVTHAVTEANAKELRQIAALQALKLNIAACGDVKALKALADVRDIGSLRSVLDKYPALGFSGPGNLNAREALVEPALLRSILGAAHVRAHLPSASTEHLKRLVAQANFATQYKQYLMSATEPPLVGQALDDYFNNPANVTKSREEALVSLLRANVRSLDDNEINDIVTAQNPQNLLDAFKINKLIGVGSTDADDLINNGPPLAFLHGLMGLAKAEQIARAAKNTNFDQPNQLGGLISFINTLSINGQPNNTQTVLRALSPSDQNNFRKQLIEILIDRYPLANPGHAPIAHLNDLIQARDTNDVKIKLANMGVTANLDWMDDSLAADLQRKAAARAATGHINAHSAFPAEAHPHLQAFISQLSLDKQKAILAKPEVLAALMKAQSIDEIRRVVGTTNSSAGDLIAENQRLSKLSKLFNPELAKILASIKPPLAVNDAQINALNQTLLTQNNIFDANNNVYRNLVGTLRMTFNPQDKAAFNQAFGLNAQGLNITNDPIRQAMATQHTRNGHLVARHGIISHMHNATAADIKEKAAIEIALRLSKTQPFDQHEIQNFRDFFENAASLNDVITGIPGNNTINTNLGNTGWQKQITPEMFDAYKQVKKQQAWLDRGNYNAPGGTKQTEQTEIQALKTKLKSITDIDDDYLQEIKHLGSLTEMQWLSPEFEVAARQAYNELHPKFKTFARDCDIILEEFRRQQKIYEDKLNSLPDTSTLNQPNERQQKKDIENFRAQLKEELALIKAGINLYEKASLALNGDPSATNELARKGLIQHLEDCKQGTNVIFATSDMRYNDFPVDEKEQHFAQGYQPGPGQQAAPDRSAISTEAPRTYTVKKLEPGMCREYVLSGTRQETYGRGQTRTVADTGTFIEEVHAGHLEPKTVKKKTEVNPQATITVSKFPKDDENQIKYAMAMASQLLAHLDHAPTKDRPLVITGSNPEELRHLWTALMVLGKNNPKMKFSQDAIKVASTAFDPDSELGKVFGLKSDALYNTYMAHPAIKQMVGLIKTFTESKEAEKSTTKDVTKKIASMLQQFKTEGKEALDNLERDLNTNRGPTLG